MTLHAAVFGRAMNDSATGREACARIGGFLCDDSFVTTLRSPRARGAFRFEQPDPRGRIDND